MEINRENYEIWIIDLLDGNLSNIEVEQVKLFLGRNPDLNEEFNELTSVSLSPPTDPFPGKHNLKKTMSEIPLQQFEYLSAAYIENDLPESWQFEMKKIIDNDPEKRRTFELIQKTKLVSAGTGYKHKKILLKKTLIQKIIRLSAIGFTAAAAIAFLAVSYLSMPPTLTEKTSTSAQNIPTGSNLQKPYFEISRGKMIKPVISVNKIRENPVPQVQNYTSALPAPETITIKPEEPSSLLTATNLSVQPVIIHKTDDLGLKTAVVSDKLVASNTTFNPPPDYMGMSNVGRFIARTFREKILREKVTKNAPLQGYEIAEAGVTGLNMLLGWNMALNEKNDENGELKSVYFSSKILNFNARVKKYFPQP